jgi:hypothetical protein
MDDNANKKRYCIISSKLETLEQKKDSGNAADGEIKVAARRPRLAVASEGGRPPP